MPTEFRVPRAGETWRHYQGKEYSIVGVGLYTNGRLQVAYTKASHEAEDLFFMDIGDFLQVVQGHWGSPVPTFTMVRDSDGMEY